MKKEKRELVEERRKPTPLRKRKGPPVRRDPSATMEPDVSGNSRERSEEGSIWGKNPDGEALRNIINELLDERNLRDRHLKYYHMSTSQFKKADKLFGPSWKGLRHLPACGEDVPILQLDKGET